MKKSKIILFLVIVCTMCLTILVLTSCKKPEKPTLTHEWQITTDATCTAPGEEKRINPETNEEESREIIPLGHVYGEFVTTREPTCTVDGSKGKTCMRCRNVVLESIPMLGHTPDEWKITVPPTCISSGRMVKQCKTCKTELESEVLDALSKHTFNEYA